VKVLSVHLALAESLGQGVAWAGPLTASRRTACSPCLYLIGIKILVSDLSLLPLTPGL